MSCDCARCALDRTRGGCGLHEHAETPKQVSGAATPTSSKFSALRRKIATSLNLAQPPSPAKTLPTAPAPITGVTAATRAPAPSPGNGPTSPKLAVDYNTVRTMMARRMGAMDASAKAHRASVQSSTPQLKPPALREQPKVFEPAQLGGSANDAFLELARPIPGQPR